jgi:maltose alpha-D-glucosyltransferase/alpha-amylase
MGDNIWLDDRNGVRTPMQWNSERNAGFSSAQPDKLYAPVITNADFGYQTLNVHLQEEDPNSLLNWIRHHLGLRKQYPTFGKGSLKFLSTNNPSVLAYLRQSGNQSLLVINNLSPEKSSTEIDLEGLDFSQVIDILDDEPLPLVAGTKNSVSMSGFNYRWCELK